MKKSQPPLPTSALRKPIARMPSGMLYDWKQAQEEALALIKKKEEESEKAHEKTPLLRKT